MYIMKRWMTAIMGIVICLSVAGGPVLAQAGSGMGSSDIAIARKFKGEVTSIDLQSQTISARHGDILFSVAFDDKTTVQKEKEIKTINDVKVGQKIIIRYLEVGGKNVAKSIFISP
jgi:hypothetical protein